MEIKIQVDKTPPQQPPPESQSVASQPPPASGGVAQMVCGSCRRLLTYPPGSKHVQCSCCHTVNLVLQAHQVGQVKCDSCAMLLVYPYGAPSVRCSSCSFVTIIGEHNKRPPCSTRTTNSYIKCCSLNSYVEAHMCTLYRETCL